MRLKQHACVLQRSLTRQPCTQPHPHTHYWHWYRLLDNIRHSQQHHAPASQRRNKLSTWEGKVPSTCRTAAAQHQHPVQQHMQPHPGSSTLDNMEFTTPTSTRDFSTQSALCCCHAQHYLVTPESTQAGLPPALLSQPPGMRTTIAPPSQIPSHRGTTAVTIATEDSQSQPRL